MPLQYQNAVIDVYILYNLGALLSLRTNKFCLEVGHCRRLYKYLLSGKMIMGSKSART
jgi:hypothetical protein